MRTRFDGFAKDALAATLEIASRVALQQGVGADTQYIDAWCEPDPARAHERARLGLLGRMTEEACALEPYHEPPDEEELLSCVRKQLTWHHALTKKARAANPGAKMVDLSPLWILSAGRPAKVIERFELTPMGDGWPAGVYTATRWLRLHLVVISELARAPETLLLRLLGAGATLRAAIADLVAMPRDAWEPTVVGPIILQFRLALPAEPSQRTPEEEEFLMTAQEYYKEIIRTGIAEGRAEGRAEGKAEGRAEGRAEGTRTLLAHQVERRIRRPLSEAELGTLHARIDALGAEQVSDIVIDLSPDALAAWLAETQPAGAPSAE